MKTILTVVMVAIIATFSFATETETSVQAATKNLMTEFSEEMNDDVNKPDNYFSINEISDIKENVKVTFYVDENQKLVLLKVKTDNNDAKNYVKHFLNKNTISADKILCGKAYTFNLYLKYRAH